MENFKLFIYSIENFSKLKKKYKDFVKKARILFTVNKVSYRLFRKWFINLLNNKFQKLLIA